MTEDKKDETAVESDLAAETEAVEAPHPGHRRVAAVKNDNGTYSLGVNRPAGSERYDTASGQLFTEIAVTREEVDAAFRDADKAFDSVKVDDGLKPKIDPEDQRADSSPRSQDRPPIRISSETAPMPANPEPSEEALAAGLPRDEEGTAQIPANVETKAQANITKEPEGVKKGPAKGGPTELEVKAARDAKAAKETPVTPSAREVGVAAARAVREGALDTPAPLAAPRKASSSKRSRSKAKAGSAK